MTVRTISEQEVRWNFVRFDPSVGFSQSGSKLFNIVTTITAGEAIPEWKYRLRNSIQATTPETVTGTKIKARNDGHALTHATMIGAPSIFDYQESKGTLAFLDYVPADPSLFVIQSVQNQVRMDMVARIRQAQTTLKGLVALGEMGESVRMVNGAGRKLFGGMRSYLDDVSRMTRQSGLRNARQLTRAVGSRWLEYAFGWKPLIGDIDDGIRAFQRYSTGRPAMIPVRAQRKSEEKNPQTAVDTTICRHSVRLTPTQSKTYGYKIYGVVGITNTGRGSLAHEFGIKLDEFVPTLWELIPYSFLVDYFINIGAVVDALSLNTSSIRWLNHGELRQSSLKVELELIKYNQLGGPWLTQKHSFDPGTPFEFVKFAKSRNGFPSYFNLVPSLQFSIPGSSTRWLNMSALGSQHFDVSRRARSYRS